MPRFLVLAAVICCAAPLSVRAATPNDVAFFETAFFEAKIRPVFVEHCYECHSSRTKEPKGGLRLDGRDVLRRGGETGPAILPGKPDESLLFQALKYDGAVSDMPPKGKLPGAVIENFRQWIASGAVDPREETGVTDNTALKKPDPDVARRHWAYQPLQSATVPMVREVGWPTKSVDHFILAALDERGWQHAPDADPYTWLRRVTLDITGLPPTEEEVEDFVQSAIRNPQSAIDSAVDRLLVSPRFGERWARHWLDLVGYADQIGSANNVPAEHAWRYRDYVIRAFNADKPFDEFIREQLAGDMLTATSIKERQDQLTATGFLVLGNVNVVEADKLIMQMDLVDQQIEKIGKTFLGMTLQCARCHDHKFDPITLSDYYGLAGIFASTESTYKAERGIWSSVTKVALPETIEQFSQREAAEREHRRKLAETQKEQAAAKKDDAAKQKEFVNRLLHLAYLAPQPPLAFSVKDAPDVGDAQRQVRGNPHTLGESVPRGFVKVATFGPSPLIPPDQSGRLQLAEWLTGAASPLTARVTVNRIWQKLFGRGLVGSVDYVGVRGETPSHPELLEHLAGQFIRNGWSQKRLIRELVLSRTYRQSTISDFGLTSASSVEPRIADSNPSPIPQSAIRNSQSSDPDNKFLWRFSPRRLDAEMLRDSVLAVSGALRVTAGGPALAPEFMENVGGLNPKDVNPISFSLTKFRDEQSFLRTVYLPVVRSSGQRGPAEVLNFFDFPQPGQLTGIRPTTTVASQALFLLNGPLLKDASRRLASDLLADPALDDNKRLARLYLRVLNRPITPAEIAEVCAFFLSSDHGSAAREADWQRLAHALLASNEFLFRQ